MAQEQDEPYYARRAQQQLDIAALALNPAIKAIHLDLASRYAALRELAGRGVAPAEQLTIHDGERIRRLAEFDPKYLHLDRRQEHRSRDGDEFKM